MAFKCCFGFFGVCFGFIPRNKSRESLIDESNMNYDVLPRYNPQQVNPRQVLTSEYIRSIIDSNYEPTNNWFDFASINGITAFLQREYSPLINADMVYEALLLEPHYKISYRMDAPGCRFIRHKMKY
jgi:hypothetical protein